MKRITFILFVMFSCACLCRSSSAQVIVENAISTDSVDLFTEPEAKAGLAGISPTLAMVSSLVLPGSGHHFLERNRSALACFTAEAAAVFGFFFCDHYAKKLAVDATGYAWTHAGAQGSIKSADDYYWKQVARYMDVQDYNSMITLDRLDAGKKYTSESQYWRWDDESSKDRFNSILSKSRLFGVVSSFCLGVLVLDRIIAFIDIRSVTRNYGTKQTGHASLRTTVHPSVSVTSTSVDLRFTGTF